MAESVRSSQSNGGSSRHEKSLGLLTIKFVTLLQEAKDGVLDLKVVSYELKLEHSNYLYWSSFVCELSVFLAVQSANVNKGQLTPFTIVPPVSSQVH